MSFEPPAGILDIGNATLRVGKLEVAETTGLNQGLQNIVKNDLLITETDSYTTSKSWGLKLPTTWVAEFDLQGQTGKYVEFNFYNEGSTSNAQGYTLNFKDTSLTLKYDNGTTLASATIPTIVGTFRKVNIFFERGVIAVSIDGARVLYYKESDGFNNGLGVASRVVSTTGGAFLNAFIQGDHGGNSIFKNLRIVNGRFISDKTSNVSFIGSLGVGVNTPKESLDVLGNMHLTRVSNVSQVSVDSNVVTEYTGPHDRPLRKYPEVALTADAATASGYKGYKVTSSFDHATYQDWNAFDGVKDATVGWHTGSAATNDIQYTGTDGEYNGTNATQLSSSSNTVNGEYLQIELPKAIKLKYYILYPQGTSGVGQDNSPKRAVLYGSNDGSAWTEVHRYTDAIYDSDGRAGVGYTFHVNSNQSYNYFAIVPTHRDNTAGTPPNSSGVTIAELEFYGHEEGSGSLDTTLKSVYNVPATTGTQLEVYYDGQETSSYPESGGTTVYDISPNTNNGTLNGGVGFDSTYKAFTFGAGDYIQTQTLPSTFIDDAQHSIAIWFNLANHDDSRHLFWIDDNTTGVTNQSPHAVISSSGILRYDFFANHLELLDQIVLNQWYHLVITFSGGNHSSGTKFYINGVHNTNVATGGSNAGDTLDIQASSYIVIGGNNTTTTSSTFNGSIANFRLYSKALNADQVKELYDYQKDYFLGSKSQVTLYKGHLGVGVTEPSGQLELAGDERIQEYPPRAITVLNYHTHIEGHGEFEFYSSQGTWDSTYSGNTAWDFTKAFENTTTSGVGWHGDGTSAAPGTYQAVAVYAPAVTSGDGLVESILKDGSIVLGEWIEMRSPYAINITRLATAPRQGYGKSRGIGKFIILGSNNGVDWEYAGNGAIAPHDTSSTTDAGGYGTRNSETIARVSTNSNGHYYTHHRLVVTHIMGHQGASGHPVYYSTALEMVNVSYLRFFGTPGPTTLDKGSLSLTRSLDVPRVSRYDVDTETPRPEKLVLDFDTTVNSSPTDISGRGNHGTFKGTNMKYSAAYKAFVFNGTDDYIQGTLNVNGSELDTSYTLSVWVKSDSTANETATFMFIGASDSGDSIGFRHNNNSSSGGTEYRIYHFALKDTSVTGQPSNLNQWRHLVAVYDGTDQIIYVDGVFAGKDAAPNLGLPNNPTYSIGYRWDVNGGANEYFDGMISNPKVYSVALEPSEVRKLYNLGRTGRSMVISDTAVGIGKAPEAQLDVRGNIRLENLLLGGYIGHRLIDEAELYYNPMLNECQDSTQINGTAVGDAKGNYPGTTTGIIRQAARWVTNGTGSSISTNATIDLRRDWTIMVWNFPPAANLGSHKILGHGVGQTNKGLHVTGTTATNVGYSIRYGMHGNDVDGSTNTGMTDERHWSCYIMTYNHNGGVAGGVDRKMFQNERLVIWQQGGIGEGANFQGVSGGSAASSGHQPYQATPTVLRFGTAYGSGNFSQADNHIGPCLFIPRCISDGEARSLFKYFNTIFPFAGKPSG